MRHRAMILGIGGAVALAVLPALALAARAHYHGPVAGGVNNAFISFDTSVKNGDVKNVHGLRWGNILVTCQPSGSGATTENAHLKMKVDSQGEFKGKGTSAHYNDTVRVKGEFTHHDKRAHGTIRVTGAVPGAGSDCDTGLDDWSAKRTG